MVMDTGKEILHHKGLIFEYFELQFLREIMWSKFVIYFSQPSYGHYGGYRHKGYGYKYDDKHIYDTYKKVEHYSKKQDVYSYEKVNS